MFTVGDTHYSYARNDARVREKSFKLKIDQNDFLFALACVCVNVSVNERNFFHSFSRFFSCLNFTKKNFLLR